MATVENNCSLRSFDPGFREIATCGIFEGKPGYDANCFPTDFHDFQRGRRDCSRCPLVNSDARDNRRLVGNLGRDVVWVTSVTS